MTPVILFAAASVAATDWAYEDGMQAIVDQINEGAGQAFSDAVDIDGLLARVFENVEISDRTKAGFSRQMRQGKKRLGENLVRKIPEGSYAILLDVRQEDERAFALVRYDTGNLRFGYNVYELVKDGAGSVRIVDWMDYLDAFRYSDALRLSAVTYEPTAASVRSLVPLHKGGEEEWTRFAEVIAAYRRQDHQKFYAASATLTRALRQSRLMHLLTCLVSRMSRDKNLYNDAYRALASNFSDDPTIALTLIPYYFEKGDRDEAMDSLRLLQRELDIHDGALLAFMARTAMGLGNAHEASILADEAVANEPTLEGAYWAAIDAHVALGNHSFAMMTARSLEEQFGEPIAAERFEDRPMYGNLVNSPEYREWKAEKQRR
jgi:hypothetical protein